MRSSRSRDRKPSLNEGGPGTIQATHAELGKYWLHCDGAPELLFTENESNAQRLWGRPNTSSCVKDAFHAYVIAGQHETVNPGKTGTKAAAHYVLDVPGGGSKTVQLRLTAARTKDPFDGFEQTFASRIADADEFYERIAPSALTEDHVDSGPPRPRRRSHAVVRDDACDRPAGCIGR